jgi:EAL domain-containing protein (putative c-di-GMP-specific phosphodiesterase class I)
MPNESAEFSDHPPVEHLLFLPPNLTAGLRLRAELAAAGLVVTDAGGGLRVEVGELDWQAVLEGVGAALSDHPRRDTRVALLPRDADDRARRRAVAVARPLTELLDRYSDAWLCHLMQRNGLSVHFQPLVEYPPGRVHGYECLVRGVGADGGLLPPARLFAAAGRLGLSYLLDRQSCRTAVAAAAAAAAAAAGLADVRFFVNVTTAPIGDPAVHAAATRAAVEAGGLRPGQVTFEVVDAETCRDPRKLAAIVRGYRDAGFGVSLDDVGAGAASLLRLDDLRPDYVKLDAELCRRAPDDRAAADLLKELTDGARRAGAAAVAKGVETEEQLRFAIDAGVELTQGHVHATAAPAPLDKRVEERMLRQVRRTAILAAV